MSIFIQLGLNDAVIAVKDLLLVNLYDLSFICVKDRRDNFDSDLIKLLILDLFKFVYNCNCSYFLNKYNYIKSPNPFAYCYGGQNKTP